MNCLIGLPTAPYKMCHDSDIVMATALSGEIKCHSHE